jgi:outer membrane protein TolC
MENTILMVAQYYYDVCRARQNLTLAGESMNISRDRLTRTIDQKAYGQATQLNILNAEVDLNSDSTFILRAEQAYLMTVKNLNVVMGIPIEETYTIDDSITFRDDLSAENIMDDVLLNNSRLLAQKQQESLTNLNLKITEAGKFPKLSAYGQYGYNHQDFNTGALLSNQAMGPSAGLTFRFNVFNGNQQRTREQNARLDLLSQQERSLQLQSEMERDAANAFTDYDYKRRISQLQQSSLDRAKLNFEKTSELYQLGRATSLEFRTAQQNMLNVANQYNEALFLAKVAEFNLLKLSGKLIKE